MTATEIDYTANIEALERVQPEWLSYLDIAANLGAPWIPVHVYTGFAESLIRSDCPQVLHEPHSNTWRIELSGGRWSRLAEGLGGGGKTVWDLLTDSLNQKQSDVFDKIDDKRVKNEAATLAARERQSELQAEFEQWVWSDQGRINELETVYNQRFNSHVIADYDGSHLALPGLSAVLTPHGYQRDAVWRTMTSENDTLLRHATGAGKTIAASIAVMELKRIGAINKPLVVVPNHMLDEWARQIQQAYPLSKVLLATREMTAKQERQRFAATCALGDWDVVVISESAFTRIPLTATAQASHLADSLTELDTAVEAAQVHGDRWTVKRVEKMRERVKAKHRELMSADTKDQGVTFEQLGCDFLVVDELHRFKNLSIVSNIREAGGKGSQRAEDLAAKLGWLRRTRPGCPVVLGLTATPISNGVAEMHTITRYIAPEVLDHAGVSSFDAWAGTFAQVVNMFELAPEGSTYRTVDRFARFHNVPELASMYLRFADVVTEDDLAGNQPDAVRVTHEIEPGRNMDAAMGDVLRRADLVRKRMVTPEDDNMLSVATTGRLVAVDPRLAGYDADDTCKLVTVADTVAERYAATATMLFEGSDLPGGTQLVFCDLGTPARAGWNVYRELADLLAERGVAVDHVRFVQSAKTDAAKAALFADMRSGRVRVLLGSTETCGVGMNVQTRLTDLHHVSPPWKPAEVEQRDGRGIRQGNLNSSVRLHTYVVVGSFDAYNWTILSRKAGFLAQLGNGSIQQRTLDVLDLDDRVISFEEIKAIASGNPLVLRKAELDAEHYRLTRLRGQHAAAATRARRSIDELVHNRSRATTEIRSLTDLVATIDGFDGACSPDGFHTAPVDGATVAVSRDDLIATFKEADERGHMYHRFQYRGVPVRMEDRSVIVGDWRHGVTRRTGSERRPGHMYNKVVAVVNGLRGDLHDLIGRVAGWDEQIVELEALAAVPWPHGHDLAAVAAELVDVEAALTETVSETTEQVAA